MPGTSCCWDTLFSPLVKLLMPLHLNCKLSFNANQVKKASRKAYLNRMISLMFSGQGFYGGNWLETMELNEINCKTVVWLLKKKMTPLKKN